MIRQLAISLLLAGAACTQVQQAADDVARNQAKQVVDSQVASVLPGVDLSFATDCIIDNASAQELLILARASVVGPDTSTGQLMQTIGTRPDTLQCILNKRLSL